MITSMDIVPHRTHFALHVHSTVNRLETHYVAAYIHPVDGAWVIVTQKGVPTMVCMDVTSLIRRLHHRYGIVPTYTRELTDFPK